MLELTFSNGRTFRRVFCGRVKSSGDLDKFIAELRHEITDALAGELFCEIWKVDIKVKQQKGLPMVKSA